MDLLTMDMLRELLLHLLKTGIAVLVMAGITKGIISLHTFTREQKLARLRRKREQLKRLHESDRAYYGWFVAALLIVFLAFAMEMAFRGSVSFNPRPELQRLLAILQWGVGYLMVWFTGACLKRYHDLEHFDRTITRLDRKIAQLESKLPHGAQPAASSGD